MSKMTRSHGDLVLRFTERRIQFFTAELAKLFYSTIFSLEKGFDTKAQAYGVTELYLQSKQKRSALDAMLPVTDSLESAVKADGGAVGCQVAGRLITRFGRF